VGELEGKGEKNGNMRGSRKDSGREGDVDEDVDGYGMSMGTGTGTGMGMRMRIGMENRNGNEKCNVKERLKGLSSEI
jgi:hypothetical protein